MGVVVNNLFKKDGVYNSRLKFRSKQRVFALGVFHNKLSHFFFLLSFFHSSFLTASKTSAFLMDYSGSNFPSSKGIAPARTPVLRGRTTTVEPKWATTSPSFSLRIG